MSMQVADLFARMGFRVDKGQQAKAQASIQRFGAMAKKALLPLAGLASGAALFQALRGNQEFAKSLVRLEIASKGAIGTSDELRKKILQVSDATGIARDKVLQGAASFISLTGDSKSAADQLETFAKVAQASGADTDDVARSAAAMSQSMGIASKDFEKGFSILIAGGKAGSVELKNVAQVMAKLSAVSSNFAGGTGLDALASTSAGLQLVTRAFGGEASEGANALRKLMGTMVKSAPKLKEAGVSIFNVDPETGKKVRRNFQDIIEDIEKSSLSKDPTALAQAFGSKEALAAYEQLVLNKDEWRALTKEVRNANDVQEDYAKVSAKASIKISKAWNKVSNLILRGAAAVTDVLMVLAGSFDAVKVTVLLAVSAFALFRIASVAAALQTAAAWALAAAPIILMVGLIALLYLIVQDFLTFMEGGESVIGTIWDGISQHWKDTLMEFFEWFEKKINSVALMADDFVSFFTGSESKREKRNKAQAAAATAQFARDRSGRSLEDRNLPPLPVYGPPTPTRPNTGVMLKPDGSNWAEYQNQKIEINVNGVTDPIAVTDEVEKRLKKGLKDQ